MQNRRNLYRLLHVQRDAPAAIIKGSYRTLMQTLRKHPDLGGDEWDAQLLNEARRILCDPQARARYDATLASESTDRVPTDRQPATPTENASTRPDRDASPRDDDRHCHYCGALVATPSMHRNAYASPVPGRCQRCDAPTRAAPSASDSVGGAGRRRLHRIVDGANVTVVRHWPDNVTTNAVLLEFSTTGCALVAGTGMADAEVVLLRTPRFIATGTVRTSLPVEQGARYRIGIAFVGVEVHASPGSVFSASV